MSRRQWLVKRRGKRRAETPERQHERGIFAAKSGPAFVMRLATLNTLGPLTGTFAVEGRFGLISSEATPETALLNRLLEALGA